MTVIYCFWHLYLCIHVALFSDIKTQLAFVYQSLLLQFTFNIMYHKFKDRQIQVPAPSNIWSVALKKQQWWWQSISKKFKDFQLQTLWEVSFMLNW